ncbi:MAG: hypothetical protein WAS33_29740 [Candidatus Promineifilaceae bacterium]
MTNENEIREAEATTILEVSGLSTTDQVVQIFTAIGTAVALILLAFGLIGEPAGDNEATARGVTNFDSITLSDDLVVGGSVTIDGDTVDAIYADSATVTGTLAITASTHSLSAITAAGCSLGESPGTGAGDGALCWVGVSGTTATITVEQDDWTTNASSGTVINYWIIGTP